MPGPIPFDAIALAQPRKAARGEVTKGAALPFTWPDPDPMWHPEATALYEAARTSGQRDFYQATDVAMLRFLLTDLSHYRTSARPSGQHLAALLGGLSSLLLTVGERRRARIELTPHEESDVDRQIEALLSGFEDTTS